MITDSITGKIVLPSIKYPREQLRFGYPRSFLKLLLIGFLLAILPLLFAFIRAASSIDSIEKQSRRVVLQAVQATHSSQIMTEQITKMERSIRLYLILGDTSLLDNFESSHKTFEATVLEIKRLPLDAHQLLDLSTLIEHERAIHQIVNNNPVDAAVAKTVAEELAKLYDQSQEFIEESNQLIHREIADLQKMAESTKNTILWQALGLTPIALLIAMVITVLIVQPLRLIDDAIKRLGRGQLISPISISGPDNLRMLGQRLDWLRQQMLDEEEQKNRFLRHVSHELKTPLTAIREGSELLSEEITGTLSESQREITDIMRMNSLKLQKLIESLLTFSAAHFQSLPLQTTSVDLKPLIESVVRDHTLEITNKQIRLELTLGDVTLQGDKAKLATVFDNLLSNAIKFSPASGVISIQLTSSMQHAIVDVRDSGPGVVQQDYDRLFEPFHTGSTPHNSHVNGSGLGLSITKEIVLAHNGYIDIVKDSNAPGAHFRVTLPLTPIKRITT